MTLVIVVALLGATGFMFTKTTTELAPEEDQGALFAASSTAPRYATADYTAALHRRRSSAGEEIPEIDDSS